MAINGEQDQLNNANQANGQQSQTATPSLGGGASASPGATPGRTAAFSDGSPSTNSGSGRFTNLQNYVNANQGATDRLYQGIGNKIDTTAQPGKDNADTQASAVKSGIQAANTNLNRGQGYYNQMQGPAFNAQDFTANQNQLKDYSTFQAGKTVDTGQLNSLNNNAQTAAMQVQDNYKNRANQVNNEQGRFGLLQETYGQNQPGYNAGQQRLDNLFLQNGAGGKVNALQNDVRGQLNTANQNLAGLQGQTTTDINGVATNQTGLAKNLYDLSNQNEQGFVKNLNDQVAGVNDTRHADISQAQKSTAQLAAMNTPGQVTTGDPLSDQYLSEIGLNRGTRTYNAFGNGAVTNLNQLANVGRDAKNAQDLATQGDANQYDALSKLAFSGLDNAGNYTQDTSKKQINGASTLDPAVKAIMDANGVSASQGLVNGAQNAFNDYAKNATITGTGGAYTGDYGEIGVDSSANANLAQLLSGQGASVAESGTNNRGRFGQLGKTALNSYDFGANNTIDNQQDLLNRIQSLQGQNQFNGGTNFNQLTKNYSVDPSQTTRNIDVAGAGITGDQGDKFLRDLYHSSAGTTLQDIANVGLPGLGQLAGGIAGNLFGSKSRKNENLDQTAAYLQAGANDAYTGSNGSSTDLYHKALQDLSNRGYFNKV
jgi:hypothetical protein